eukprot:gnl/MRDRNA2_/MRDRNA2_64129_c1_seq1.p1 gnl/MRDRNA2_/MRDRNA2_64129_c1~~gnl/MRDRNA2_/MRDRNA2_64129_c1_seq1.p1  ORF type:complete len:345 (-),score=44.35 gnl/MRDRNA2_/MRDRNA2_64129_c1_seq1:140-1174(-)
MTALLRPENTFRLCLIVLEFMRLSENLRSFCSQSAGYRPQSFGATVAAERTPDHDKSRGMSEDDANPPLTNEEIFERYKEYYYYWKSNVSTAQEDNFDDEDIPHPAVWPLHSFDKERWLRAVDKSVIIYLIKLMKHGKKRWMNEKAAEALWKFSINDSNQHTIVDHEGIDALVKVMNRRGYSDGTKGNATLAIRNFVFNPGMQPYVTRAGGTEVLFKLYQFNPHCSDLARQCLWWLGYRTPEFLTTSTPPPGQSHTVQDEEYAGLYTTEAPPEDWNWVPMTGEKEDPELYSEREKRRSLAILQLAVATASSMGLSIAIVSWCTTFLDRTSWADLHSERASPASL